MVHKVSSSVVVAEVHILYMVSVDCNIALTPYHNISRQKPSNILLNLISLKIINFLFLDVAAMSMPCRDVIIPDESYKHLVHALSRCHYS